MLTSRSMATLSYSFHRVLTGGALVACINFLLFKLCNQPYFAPETFHYSSKFIAIYCGVLTRTIASSCGYLGLYMGLCIALDRCLALLIPMRYVKMAYSGRFCHGLIGLAIIFSIFVHSWPTLIEKVVLEQKYANMTLFTFVDRVNMTGILCTGFVSI